MHPLLFIVFLLLTFGTSVLLAGCFLRPARPAVAGIGLLVFWLCTLIVPIQWLASLDLAGLTSHMRLGHLFFWNGLAFACACALWWHRMRLRGRRQHVEIGTELRLPIRW